MNEDIAEMGTQAAHTKVAAKLERLLSAPEVTGQGGMVSFNAVEQPSLAEPIQNEKQPHAENQETTPALLTLLRTIATSEPAVREDWLSQIPKLSDPEIEEKAREYYKQLKRQEVHLASQPPLVQEPVSAVEPMPKSLGVKALIKRIWKPAA